MFDPEKRDYTLGAIEVGTTVSAILYGMVLVQGRMYSMASMTDQQWMKMLVLLVMLLETLHMVSMIAYVYYATVTHMDPSALMAVKWFTVINITLSNLIGSPVQAYFTWRAWIVSGRAWYATPPWYAEIARTMLVIASCVLLAESETITQFNITRANLTTSALASCLLIDIWNSAVLCYHLKRKRIAFEKTLKYVNSIVIWSIETSLFICALAGFSLVFWLVMPQNAIWLAFLMVHAKIYSNSMMISLNGRIIRKAKTARPQDLQRSWELGHHRSPSGAHSSGTQQDSGAFMLHSDDSPQFALVNYDSKFSIPTSLYSPRLSSTSHTAGIRPLPKLVEDV